MPVLNQRDRRAYLRSLWSPVIPEADWLTPVERPLGSANVYLDVSGSMNHEMPLVVGMLIRLRHAIRMPFWAFSNTVAPAMIRQGKVITRSTGGTSMACVLVHLAKTRPAAAVVLTDGFVERLDPILVQQITGIRLHAVVTRGGSPAEFDRAGISYSQLGRFPNG